MMKQHMYLAYFGMYGKKPLIIGIYSSVIEAQDALKLVIQKVGYLNTDSNPSVRMFEIDKTDRNQYLCMEE